MFHCDAHVYFAGTPLIQCVVINAVDIPCIPCHRFFPAAIRLVLFSQVQVAQCVVVERIRCVSGCFRLGAQVSVARRHFVNLYQLRLDQAKIVRPFVRVPFQALLQQSAKSFRHRFTALRKIQAAILSCFRAVLPGAFPQIHLQHGERPAVNIRTASELFPQ